jgi:hypothetical protein
VISPTETDEVLATRLAALGVDTQEVEYSYHGAGRDARVAWEAFKELAFEPLESWVDEWGQTNLYRAGGDHLNLNAGLQEAWRERRWEGFDRQWPQVFVLDFNRLMDSEDDAGEHLAIWIFRMTLEFEFNDDLRAFVDAKLGDPKTRAPWEVVAANVGGVGPASNAHARSSVDDWIARVEASDVFGLAFAAGANAFHFEVSATGD